MGVDGTEGGQGPFFEVDLEVVGSMRSKSISMCLAKYICKVMVNFGDMLFDTVRKFGRACGRASSELVQ